MPGHRKSLLLLAALVSTGNADRNARAVLQARDACTQTYVVVSGDSVGVIATKLKTGTGPSAPATTPTPVATTGGAVTIVNKTMDGIACTKEYFVVSGDTPPAICKQQNTYLASIYKLNPLKCTLTSCALSIGEELCLSTAGVPYCNTWVTEVGQGCWDIYTGAGIT
ncbi:hypothetical protein HDU87_002056 [Geranomyces variabilis]|uniref:LysM domain-containing protein n=1 Tax=Geranomyces variabilis TaxID=109894 RepID=A0AAD5XSD5_9FUNG|nr:hypothetical protein HDU87_002056 [Geranomyces variabilis]